MTTTLIEMRKASENGFERVIVLTQNNHEQGGKTYHMNIYQDWSAGKNGFAAGKLHHEKYRQLDNAKQANDSYKQFLQMGYKVTRRDKFQNIEMDMR